MDTNNGEEKKRPGRPRKNRLRAPNPRNGISTQPYNRDSRIEFVYDHPLIFKKLWGYYKSMAVEKIQMIFRRDQIIIWGNDHHGKSRIRTRINTRNVNHYFQGTYLDIGVMCSDLEKIMGNIDRSCSEIAFLSRENYAHKNIQFTIKNDMKIEKNHIVELIGDYPRIENEEEFLDTNYTIQFVLPGRYFKKMISDMCNLSNQMTIRQDGVDCPLVFEYITNDKKIKSYDVVRDSSMINFKSNIVEDDTFHVSVSLDYIKPISAAFLTENVTIMAHENKNIMFSIIIDEGAIEIKIITDIINFRDEL